MPGKKEMLREKSFTQQIIACFFCFRHNKMKAKGGGLS